MATAVKGDRAWDEQFQAKVSELHEDFWDNWRQADIDTVKHTAVILAGMLPKLVEMSHTRGKQGHGKK